jgi:hypothetical protein
MNMSQNRLVVCDIVPNLKSKPILRGNEMND